jgi:four helix bundle protein
MKIKSFEDLEIYKLSIVLAKNIYEMTAKLPSKERFNIMDQLIRAVASIGANIAEGFGRNSTKEFLKFLYNARGSLLETRHFLNLARELNYLQETSYQKLRNQTDILGIKLNNFINVLKKQLPQQ